MNIITETNIIEAVIQYTLEVSVPPTVNTELELPLGHYFILSVAILRIC